jgi:hypothetical protein
MFGILSMVSEIEKREENTPVRPSGHKKPQK